MEPRCLLTVFLLESANIACLHGGPVAGAERNLHCVNDYLSTINCSLSLPLADNSSSSYWLNITEKSEKKPHMCLLTKTNGEYFCSVKTSNPESDDDDETFSDWDMYEISLCHNGTREMLDNKYEVDMNIKPNTPCCLTVSHNSSRHHFAWKNTYEQYNESIALPDNLIYQLRLYKPGDEQIVLLHEINTDRTKFCVDSQNFAPDTKYAARVRTSPNQVLYKGEWSDWSSEAHWGTGSTGLTGLLASTASTERDLTFAYVLAKVLVPLCVLVPLLLLCSASVKIWRQTAFIPTPAPYFYTLYNECQGDFKSWVVAHDKTADVLKAEETLKFDTLIRCSDIQEEGCCPKFHPNFMEGSGYTNITHPGCDECLLGVPYAVSTMVPPSGGSLGDLTLSSQTESPTKEYPRYYLMKGSTSLYCNEYCTLNAFHMSHQNTAEKHGRTSEDPTITT